VWTRPVGTSNQARLPVAKPMKFAVAFGDLAYSRRQVKPPMLVVKSAKMSFVCAKADGAPKQNK
jgi:hypothetical protein